MTRHTGHDASLKRSVLEACAAACKACEDVCEGHGSRYEHCRVCAEVCRRCEKACREMTKSLGRGRAPGMGPPTVSAGPSRRRRSGSPHAAVIDPCLGRRAPIDSVVVTN
ncbi:four-helix bundle copper-binding protein [Mycobacterium sp. HUMS_1102779]